MSFARVKVGGLSLVFNPTSHVMRIYLLKGPGPTTNSTMVYLVCVSLFLFFFWHTSGDGFFSPDIQSRCMVGISLRLHQKFLVKVN